MTVPTLQVDAPENDAGPSTATAVTSFTSTPIADAPVHHVQGPATAPSRRIPRTTFSSVEYPGPVSHHSALLKVIRQDDLDECINTPILQQGVLEMSYRLGDSSTVPVRGHRVATAKMLFRVKRRRKRATEDSADEDQDGSAIGNGARASGSKGNGSKGGKGVFVAESMGTIPHTVRFRYYHHTPRQDTRVAQLLEAMKSLDYDAFLNYEAAPLDERFTEPTSPPAPGTNPADHFPYRSLLDLHPPPLFTRTNVPAAYSYRNSPQSIIQTVTDPRTGQMRERYVNRSRQQEHGVSQISHQHAAGDVPNEPSKAVKGQMNKMKPAILDKLKSLFEQRPVWLRASLLAHFNAEEVKELTSQRLYLAALCYMIGAGPYWKCLVRYGYDPCADPAARRYQRVFFYLRVQRARAGPNAEGIMQEGSEGEDEDDEDENGDGEDDEEGDDAEGGEKESALTLNKRYRQKWEAEQEKRIAKGDRGPLDPLKGHIFDGIELHADRPDYQICDIIDPLIKRYIDDESLWLETCDSWSGWYKRPAISLIRNLTKVKYAYIHEKNKPPPNSICFSTIEGFERELKAERDGAGDGDGDADADEDGGMEGIVNTGEEAVAGDAPGSAVSAVEQQMEVDEA